MEHAIGHRAYLSQALCMSSFAAHALLDLFKWIVSESSLIVRLFSVSDVITPFALTALLFELNIDLFYALHYLVRPPVVVINRVKQK